MWFASNLIMMTGKNDKIVEKERFCESEKIKFTQKMFFFLLSNFPLQTMEEKLLIRNSPYVLLQFEAYKITWQSRLYNTYIPFWLLPFLLFFCSLWLIKFMLFDKIQLFYWDNVGAGFFFFPLHSLFEFCLYGCAVMQVARVQ